MQVKIVLFQEKRFQVDKHLLESLYYGNAIVERLVSYPWIFPGTELLFVELEDF